MEEPPAAVNDPLIARTIVHHFHVTAIREGDAVTLEMFHSDTYRLFKKKLNRGEGYYLPGMQSDAEKATKIMQLIRDNRVVRVGDEFEQAGEKYRELDFIIDAGVHLSVPVKLDGAQLDDTAKWRTTFCT